MSEVVFNQVWKRYNDQVVLERLNLTVHSGDFCTIVGASGCGKTTFLNMLLGTEQVSQGSILIDGQAIQQEPHADRGIVFQRYSVFPHLNCLQNVMFGLELSNSRITGKLFGAAKRAAQDEAQAMLDAVGLGSSASKYPSELSGGMRQRLALAQSLIMKPKILLLDEPFGALDPGIRADMHQLVLSLWAQHKLTVFMVTHDLTEGFYLGTRLLVFDRLRRDPQEPAAFGAGITFDLPIHANQPDLLESIQEEVHETSRFINAIQ